MATKKRKVSATKLTCKRVSKNPHMADDKWGADHWRCTMSRRGKRMAVFFSKGHGHHGKPPTSGEIIESLAMDASGYENARGYEDWASEYGYERAASGLPSVLSFPWRSSAHPFLLGLCSSHWDPVGRDTSKCG